MFANIGKAAKNFYVQPYNSGMSAAGWFAFVGLLIAISVLWGFLLHHFKISE